jgi:hypothetical protein
MVTVRVTAAAQFQLAHGNAAPRSTCHDIRQHSDNAGKIDARPGGVSWASKPTGKIELEHVFGLLHLPPTRAVSKAATLLP